MATVLASGRQAWVYADAANPAPASSASTTADVWKDAAAYEFYVGRWSRAVAVPFLGWLSLPPGATWLDFGCGSGALAQTILHEADPRQVVGCDQSDGYVRHASEQTNDPRAHFAVASLGDLPSVDGGFDACVSGLVLNFLPAPGDGVAALRTCGTMPAACS
jgi:ubiquinone/menaquinone biosynthesis C-methylase UbiE